MIRNDHRLGDDLEIVQSVRLRRVIRAAGNVKDGRVELAQIFFLTMFITELMGPLPPDPPEEITPLFCTTRAFARGSMAVLMAINPPQLFPPIATRWCR